MLVHSEHGDGVAVWVHAGSRWVGCHLASPVHPARIMDWQHHPLTAMDWVTGIQACWSWVSLLLLCEKKSGTLMSASFRTLFQVFCC